MLHLLTTSFVFKVVRITGGVMNKLFKCFIINLLLSMLVFVSVPSQITNASVSTRRTNITQDNFVRTNDLFCFLSNSTSAFLDITYNLTIKSGKADYYVSVIPQKGGSYSTISMKLQRYKDGSWKTINSGSAKGNGSQLDYGTYYVSKGYKYRATATIKNYSSKGGKLLGSKSITTATRTY